MSADAGAVREEVKARYAEAARGVSTGSKQGCGSGSCCASVDADSASFGEALYDAEQRAGLPADAARASLGCGNPTAVADLREGETVLDLGSGGGIDVLLSERRVGATGVGLRARHDGGDARAGPAQQGARRERRTSTSCRRRDRERAAAGRERRRRDLELRHQPLDGQGEVLERGRPRAQARRPGRGQRRRRRGPALGRGSGPSAGPGSGCIAGALSVSEYVTGLEAAGLSEVEVTFTHEVADGMHGAIVRAVKPESSTRELPLVGAGVSGACC